jgi:hypothetical protein
MYNTVILKHTFILFFIGVLLNPINLVRYCAFIFKICNSFLKIKILSYGLGDRTLDALAKFLEDGGLTEQPPKEDGKKQEEEDVVVEVEDEVVEVEDEEGPPKSKDEL